jgi:hypothetical protein
MKHEAQLDALEFLPYGYVRVREGKTQSAERILPLTRRSREVLLISRKEPRRKRWVFPGPDNSGHLISIQKSHRRALQKPGWTHFLSIAGGTRSESGVLRVGWISHTLAKLMGHSSPRISEKYYIHVTEPHISSGFEALHCVPGEATRRLAANGLGSVSQLYACFKTSSTWFGGGSNPLSPTILFKDLQSISGAPST